MLTGLIDAWDLPWPVELLILLVIFIAAWRGAKWLGNRFGKPRDNNSGPLNELDQQSVYNHLYHTRPHQKYDDSWDAIQDRNRRERERRDQGR